VIGAANKPVYKAFGFSVTSEFPLPELLPLSVMEEEAEIAVELSDLSGLWKDLGAKQGRYTVNKNLILFQIPNVATFCIQDGRKITVSPLAGSHFDEIRLYVLGTCMGAILMQRKILSLHGSAVAIDGKAYAFVGESGAGKSTLASAFLSRGYPLLSDDVIAVSLSLNECVPVVTPSYPMQKLWQQSLEQFGMDVCQYRPIVHRETKYSVPVHTNYCQKPLPLAGVFELVASEKENMRLHRISSLERLSILYIHTYRNILISRSGLMEWHFETTAKIANQIDLFRIVRPVSEFTASELASLILTTIYEEG
jgi:hypothetical protein